MKYSQESLNPAMEAGPNAPEAEAIFMISKEEIFIIKTRGTTDARNKTTINSDAEMMML